MPVDYKGEERSNLVLSEFHHIIGTAFFCYMIFYYSGTGNSLWIANRLAASLSIALVSMPAALRANELAYTLAADEPIGFVFPVYAWAPPPLVRAFVTALNLRGYMGNYMFFVCSCGDDTGLTGPVFIKYLRKKGWKCNAGFSVIMPNIYVLLPFFDVDKPALSQSKLCRAISRVNEITRRVLGHSQGLDCFKGAFPFVKTYLINPLFMRFHMTPAKFKVSETCNGCGLCAMLCPMRNIVMKQKKPVWGLRCASCLACYHVCAMRAVSYANRTKGKGQYVHPELI